MGAAVIACFGLFMTSVYADITGTTPSSGTCLCVTGTNVNARASGKKFDHLIFLFVSFEHKKKSNLNTYKNKIKTTNKILTNKWTNCSASFSSVLKITLEVRVLLECDR